jgi:tetratricopeptide (TPR) repeat protein
MYNTSAPFLEVYFGLSIEGEGHMKINFRCKDCGQINSASKKDIDKLIKCSECGTFNVVPRKSTVADNIQTSSESRPLEDHKGIPVWAWCFFVFAGFFLAGLFAYMFWLRDTWERDNYSTIIQLKNKGAELVQSKKLKEAFEVYEELFELVGNREVESEYLRESIEYARASYEEAKNNWKSQVLTSLQQAGDQAKSLIDSGKLEEGIEKYKEVLDSASACQIDGPEIAAFMKDTLEEKLRAEIMLGVIREPPVAMGQETAAEAAKPPEVTSEIHKEKKKQGQKQIRRQQKRMARFVVDELIRKEFLISAKFKEIRQGSLDSEVLVDYHAKYRTESGSAKRGVLSVTLVLSPEGRWRHTMTSLNGEKID